eukprot:19581-Alexandrium_andersonii.AAC.1
MPTSLAYISSWPSFCALVAAIPDMCDRSGSCDRSVRIMIRPGPLRCPFRPPPGPGIYANSCAFNRPLPLRVERLRVRALAMV